MSAHEGLVVPEPGLYTFAASDSERQTKASFRRFWDTFRWFKALVELNQVTLACTRPLYERMQGLFPHAVLSWQGGRTKEADLERAAAASLQKFLDKWVRRWRDYECLDEAVKSLSPLVSPRPGVYSDEDLWAAWNDLLAQLVEHQSQTQDPPPLLLSQPPFSFAEEGAKAIHVELDSEDKLELPTFCRESSSNPALALMDPAPYESLLERCPQGRSIPRPDIDYEDSGHQPSKAIKRVLENTAADCARFVSRMNLSDWGSAKHCVIGPLRPPNQIRYTINDGGDISYQGYFTTRAESAAELSVVEKLLQQAFNRHCTKAGFSTR